MALIDAAAKSIDLPLWQLFGGAQNSITTDITVRFKASVAFFVTKCCLRRKCCLYVFILFCYVQIPIVSPAEASELAAKYRKLGFKTLKLKVGKNLSADIEVLKAIRAVHPDCLFILDANEGYSAGEAIEVLEKLNGTKTIIQISRVLVFIKLTHLIHHISCVSFAWLVPYLIFYPLQKLMVLKSVYRNRCNSRPV